MSTGAEKKPVLQKQPPEVFHKKGALEYSENITGKHLCRSLFFNKVTEHLRTIVFYVDPKIKSCNHHLC